MKKLIATSLIGLALASPVAAKHSYTFTEGNFKGQTLEFDRWSEAKCQTKPDAVMKQKRAILWNCIGRMSKDRYKQLLYIYASEVNSAKKHKTAKNLDVLNRATMAMEHPDIKWMSNSKQRHLNNLKIAGIAGGVITGATLIAIPLVHGPAIVSSLLALPAQWAFIGM